ncbi:MAG: hypothetical protein E7306_01285 [Butyrivibrio sp.]|nr:hypothetical protein [Butyrivibrio sp.]
MLGRRLFAIIIAGVLVLSCINVKGVTAYASEGGDVLFFDEQSENLEDNTEESETLDDNTEEDATLSEDGNDEDKDEDIIGENVLKDGLEIDRGLFDAELDTGDDGSLDIQNQDYALDDQSESDITYSIKFYPGEGQLISSLGLCEDIKYWEYDVVERIMTLHVYASENALRSFDFTLAVPDGSKEFDGWYYDEALTEKVDFSEGISLNSDIILYAKYNDASPAYAEEVVPTGRTSVDVPFNIKDVLAAIVRKLTGAGEPENQEVTDGEFEQRDLLSEDTGYEDIPYEESMDGDYPYRDTSNYDNSEDSKDISLENQELEDQEIPAQNSDAEDGMSEESSTEEPVDYAYDEPAEEPEPVQSFEIDEKDRALFEDVDIASSGLVVSSLYAKKYTGDEITYSEDDLRVYYNGKKLLAGTDYTVSYSDNTDAFVTSDGVDESDKETLNAPAVKLALTGNYTGTATVYFDINAMDISDAYLASSSNLTGRYYDKSFAQNPVVKADLPSGKTVTLSDKNDYEIFYNKITIEDGEEIIDFDNPLTAEEVKEDVNNCMEDNPDEDLFYLVNIEGKKNFTGVLASSGETWAPRLQVLSKTSVEANYLQLDEAKLSKKIAALEYREDDNGIPMSVSEDVIKLFKEGKIKVKIGRQELTYIEDDAANSAISEEGYYYSIVDPAIENPDINRYVGKDNYITIVPTDNPEFNRLAGSYNVFFEIKGSKISIKSINTKLNYDGNYVLVYSDKDDDGDGYFDIDTQASVERLGAVIVNSNKQVLSSDRFTISTTYDRYDVGTVTVEFKGIPSKGTTGSVSKKIKIVKTKLTSKDVKVSFLDPELDPTAVPLVGGLATPDIAVVLNDGKELIKDKDYVVSYAKNNAAGKKATITVKFDGNYKGKLSKVLTFTVARLRLDSDSIEVAANDLVYKENAGKNYFKSTPVLYNDGVKLKLNSDYVYADSPTCYYAEGITERNTSGKIVYSRKAGALIPANEVVHAGAKINMKFSVIPSPKSKNYTSDKDARGNYIPVEFSVTYRMGQMSIDKAKVTVKDQEYRNGNPAVPDRNDIVVTIGSGKKAVALGESDYVIVNVNSGEGVGKATLVIEGQGRYVGTKEVPYKIVRRNVK